jgi:aspartyl-tRNA(Asn)/glutamyl-tRNA(Gln) amidotransferase subunit A
LNCFIRVDADEARAAAEESDMRAESGETLSPLDGLTVAVKDNLAVRGKPWTAGIEGHRNLIATRDSAAVTALRAAGAVILGGLNMEEAALGAVTDNPHFGRCYNPLAEGFTPGGSSGGSGTAVAAGLVDLALGTDTMGSVRVPAAYCGIAGIKPTFGAIDRDGLAMLCPLLDTIGPMARDVSLLWPALQALAAKDVPDNWTDRTERTDLSGLRFGIPRQLADVDCEPEIITGLKIAKRAIRTLGGTVIEIDLPGWNPGKARRAGLLITEAEGAVELADLMNQPDAISDHLRHLLEYGRNASTEKLEAARNEIAKAAKVTADAYQLVDAILMPTTPQRAFAHDTPAPANQADLTALANFAGCPAVAIPVSLTGETLPASVQLMAPRWHDANLLGWAEQLARHL